MVKLRSEAHTRFALLENSARIKPIEVSEPAKLGKFYECYSRRLEQAGPSVKEFAWSPAALIAAVDHGHIRYFIDAARASDLQTMGEDELQAIILSATCKPKTSSDNKPSSKYSWIMRALN